MRKMLLTLTLAGATLFAPGLTPAAQASGWFSIGTGFRVGPLSLSFVLGQPFGRYAPAYYYRAYQPIAYPGYHCTSRCFIDHGVYYHDRACPVVQHYFAFYHVDPYRAYVNYAPRYDNYYDGGYYERHGGYGGGYYNGGGYGGSYDGRSYGSYNGYYNYDRGYSGRRDDDRYDRRDDRRYDRRYDRDDRRFRDRDDHHRRDDHRHDDRRHDGDHDHRHGDGYDRH